MLAGAALARAPTGKVSGGACACSRALGVVRCLLRGERQRSKHASGFRSLARLIGCVRDRKVGRSVREIAAKIVNDSGDYLLALKGNHPLLHQEVVEYFEHARQDRTIDARPPAMDETADKAHGRLEVRRTFCTDDLD